MNKRTELWPVTKLRRNFRKISFPEYQREPNVWSRDAKQRLIDSMARRFDIASLYFYEQNDGAMECIDGRQRINAIMSFLGENPIDSDNGFDFKVRNEIYTETDNQFAELDGLPLEQIQSLNGNSDTNAKQLIEILENYELTIVFLSGSRKPAEFNLQFTRLNLGTIINSGEKLHAMVGDMRNICFKELGPHPFFKEVSIPTRRFSKEQVAAQLLAQVFSRAETKEYARTRHFDLQSFFKQYQTVTSVQRKLVDETRATLDLLHDAFDELSVLRNRAITVSVVLLALEEGVKSKKAAARFAEFINGFVCRLRWQIGKDVDLDEEYRHLLEFQRHLTQASVEKYAVRGRAELLKMEFDHWEKSGAYRGDAAYRKRTKKDPGKDCAANN